MTTSYNVNFANQDPSLAVLLENKCNTTVSSMIDRKSMVDYMYMPYNVRYMSKFVYQWSGCILITSLSVFIILLAVSFFVVRTAWFSNDDLVASILLTIFMIISLLLSVGSLFIYRLKPRGFTIIERSYEVDASQNMYDLIPKNPLLMEEIQPYIDRAVNLYFNDKVKYITAIYLKEVFSHQDYDIKDEHVLLSKIIEKGDEDSE